MYLYYILCLVFFLFFVFLGGGVVLVFLIFYIYNWVLDISIYMFLGLY